LGSDNGIAILRGHSLADTDMSTHRTGRTLLGMAIMIPLLIAGCGRKGPLYLPEPELAPEQQTQAEPAIEGQAQPQTTTEEQAEPESPPEERTEPKQNQVR